jgi:putative endonuclease
MAKGYMYILKCSNGNYYTGSTKYLERRLEQHQEGTGARYTSIHRPVELMYYEEYERIDHAFYREKQIQNWGQKKKKALIDGDIESLRGYAKCNNGSSHLGDAWLGREKELNEEQREWEDAMVALEDRELEKEQRFRAELLVALRGLETTAKVLVLTEDEANGLEMLRVVMRSNGFYDGDTAYFSYGKKSKFKAARDAVNRLKLTHFGAIEKIIYHVDRDVDGELMEANFEGDKQPWEQLFMPAGYDLDSLFLNAEHVCALYPELAKAVVDEALDTAYAQVRDKSIDKVADGLYNMAVNTPEFAENVYLFAPSALRKRAAKLYDVDPMRYAYGKTVLGVLIGLLQGKVGSKGFTLRSSSSFLATTRLNN